MGWQVLPGRTGPHTAGHPNNLPSWYLHHPGAGSGRLFLLGAHVSIPKPGTCPGRGGEPDLAPALLQCPATSFLAAGAGSLNGRSPPCGCPMSYFLPGVNCFGKCFANCITEGLLSVLGCFDQSCLRSSFQRPG